MKRFLIIAVALAAAIPLTRQTARWTLRSVEANVAERQRHHLDKAIRWIDADFTAIQNDLRRRAENVANDPDARFLVEAELSGREPPADVETANIRFQRRHTANVPVSVELYASDGTLRAWAGPSILPQPDAVPAGPESRIAVARDGATKALVLWMTVGSGGSVRLARGIEVTPAESSFLGYVNVADRWRDKTGLQMDVTFAETRQVVDESRVILVPLTNRHADVLGNVLVSRNSGQGLIRNAERRFRDVEAFFAALLFIWIAGGLWVSTGNAMKRVRTRSIRLAGNVALTVGILAALRYALLFLDVPGRWLMRGPLQAAFDPVYMASEIAGGASRSVGDLAVSGLFVFLAAFASFRFVAFYRVQRMHRSSARLILGSFGAMAVIIALVAGNAVLVRHSVLDATLDFFAWTGLTPQPLVLVVFCSLLLSTIATIALGTTALVWLSRWVQTDLDAGNMRILLSSLGAAVVLGVPLYVFVGLNQLLSWWILAAYILTMAWLARRFLMKQTPLVRLLRIRSLLITILVSAVLLYPLLYEGMAEQRRLRVLDVADEFVVTGDASAMAAARAALNALRELEEVRELTDRERALHPDEHLLERLAREHPIVDLVPGIQRVRITIYNGFGDAIAAFEQDRRNQFRPSSEMPEPLDAAFLDTASINTVVKPFLNTRTGETIGYDGTTAIDGAGGRSTGWITMRLDRRNVQTPFGSLFGYQDWRRSLSLAEFQNGRRVRSEGENFERYVLPADVESAINLSDEVWKREEVYSRAYLTYYRRISTDMETASIPNVVAVRARAIIPYDHLYYLLRIALAGLWVGIPVFLLGLVARWRMGLIPARRSQYGDRVLDAFLIVGTLAVAGMGLVGQQVITRENDGAIRSRLQRRLQRVEDALVRTARPGETLFEVERRTPIDSLAEQLSLDLAVYRGPWLVETSTPISDAGPLMGYRLPADAYDELFIRRFRQAFVESSGRYGDTFTIGYKALADDAGWPQSVIAVLTFPEQARIREERARTTAYFFGALLLLLLVIMATATTLARALTGPLRRLRDGMQSVAAGRVQRPIPVESGDEVGQLVETFNSMQQQLSESRRKLAQQERELAWREMARQVAHEIKNPLTPMKLSIQHLQRAYEQFVESDSKDDEKFGSAFDRITRTVAEQIDTLAYIANEFSSFARMPKRHLETLDPNQIIREAAELTGPELKSGVAFEEMTEPVFVIADRDELKRVCINLIRNAVQATDGNGNVVVATRRTTGIGDRKDVDALLCEVTDDGVGIEEGLRSRIFQPNFSTKTSGMGLGLAMAKKSVEAMNGEIGFTTELGKGSTFWIKLPLVES